MVIEFDKNGGESCEKGKFEVKKSIKFLGFGAANQPAPGLVIDLEPGMTTMHPAPVPPKIPHKHMTPVDLLAHYAYWQHEKGSSYHECIDILAELERREDERLSLLAKDERAIEEDWDEEYDED